jgi:hypothetical protein
MTPSPVWREIESAPLPKFSRRHYDRRFVCLVYSDRGVELGIYSYTSEGVGCWSAYGWGPSHRVNPTHWMPLPPPPTQEQTDDR